MEGSISTSDGNVLHSGDLQAVIASATDAIVTADAKGRIRSWNETAQRFFGAIIGDITDRKRAEEELQLANQALGEKNQQLEALSAKLVKYLSRQLYPSIFQGRTDVKVTS